MRVLPLNAERSILHFHELSLFALVFTWQVDQIIVEKTFIQFESLCALSDEI